MVTKNISMRFQHSPIKTVGGVRKSTKKCLKITSFWPGTEKRKIGQPRNLYPDITFTPIHLLVKFRDDRTSGTWSKSGNGQTDGRTDGHRVIVYLRYVADKNAGYFSFLKTYTILIHHQNFPI